MTSGWTAALDCLLWPALDLAIARLSFEIPLAWLDPRAGLFRPRAFERVPGFYHRVFRMRAWKRFLPDGGSWFKDGFRKRSLAGKGLEHLERFARETCRGELAHWAMIACTPIFFLFNPLWADLVMVAFALISNLPCILVQRRVRAGLLAGRTVPARARGTVADLHDMAR